MGVDVVDNDAKASLPIVFRAFERSNSITSRLAHSTFQKSPKFTYLFKWTLYINRNPDIFLFWAITVSASHYEASSFQSRQISFYISQPNAFVRSDERGRRHDNRVLTICSGGVPTGNGELAKSEFSMAYANHIFYGQGPLVDFYDLWLRVLFCDRWKLIT